MRKRRRSEDSVELVLQPHTRLFATSASNESVLLELFTSAASACAASCSGSCVEFLLQRRLHLRLVQDRLLASLRVHRRPNHFPRDSIADQTARRDTSISGAHYRIVLDAHQMNGQRPLLRLVDREKRIGRKQMLISDHFALASMNA
jgi:hypothetical protein